MRAGRFSSQIIIFLLLTVFHAGESLAFWGFGEDQEMEKSGLDFERGYDLNTVTTVRGGVRSVRTDEGKGHGIIEIQEGGETFILVIGPKWFWSEHGITIHLRDEIAARGAKAQGKNGRTYIIVQEITNLSSGAELTLRNEAGKPVWSGGYRKGARPGTPNRPMSPGRRGGGRMGR